MLQSREENFLTLMRRGVFDNPTSPYHSLFEWAGCGLGDLQKLVREDGLESALAALYRDGVFLTHDELKGRVKIVRGGRQMLTDALSFANPTVRGVLEVSSSGSRSRGTVSTRSLAYQIHREAQESVMQADQEFDDRALVVLSAALPATTGLRRVMNARRSGHPAVMWFCGGASLPYRVLTALFVAEMALTGRPVVFPQYLPLNDFSPAAKYIAGRKQKGKAVLLMGGVSQSVRVVSAALDGGFDISGTLVITSGEALTEPKRRIIESAGCEVHARYIISEFGPVGIGCRLMEGNCVHLCRDSVAAISRRKKPLHTDVEVESLLFTTLLPSAATILVNAEMDDAGDLGPARCGCELFKMGFTQQIDKIFSYGKLTGYGTSLVGGDVLRILEKLMPDRFGGVPSDYQLVEQEGRNHTEYELRVNPRLGGVSPEEVRDFFLGEVKRLWGGSSTVSRWAHGQALKVALAEPYAGKTGKVLALHLLGRPGRDENRQG
jgi:hypothetical protein